MGIMNYWLPKHYFFLAILKIIKSKSFQSSKNIICYRSQSRVPRFQYKFKQKNICKNVFSVKKIYLQINLSWNHRKLFLFLSKILTFWFNRCTVMAEIFTSKNILEEFYKLTFDTSKISCYKKIIYVCLLLCIFLCI